MSYQQPILRLMGKWWSVGTSAFLGVLLALCAQSAVAGPYVVSKELIEDLKAISAPAPVVTKLESALGKSAPDKDGFLKMLQGIIGEEGLDVAMGEQGALRYVLPRWADARIAQDVADTRKVANPLKFAVGDAEYDKAMASGEYQYVGNLACRVCHREFCLGRKKDMHQKAFQAGVPKRLQAEERCLHCHTTGFKVPTGFVDAKSSAKMRDVSCEGCHGPGSKHEKIAKAGGLMAGADHPERLKKMCQACHSGRWTHSFSSLDAAFTSYKEAETNANANKP